MMKKILFLYLSLCRKLNIFFMCLGILSLSSCSEEPDLRAEETSAVKQEENPGFAIENDKLHFESKEDIKNFIDNSSEKEFTAEIRSLQQKGFRPLTPIFLEHETEAYDEFLKNKRKRLADKAENTLSFRGNLNKELEELDEDDEIIADPGFAAILNEDRAIYVGDSLHVFTGRGAYSCKIEDEQYLYDYLNELESGDTNAKQSKTSSKAPPEPQDMNCPNGTELVSEIIDGRMTHRYVCRESSYTPPTNIGSDIPAKLPHEIKQNLGFCAIEGESLWQKVFGEAETCHDYFDSSRRVKVKFWNQNYFVYSSIGVMVKFQKKYTFGWQKSNAVDYTEMGINYAEYTFPLNITGYNALKEQGVIAKYKGVTYKTDGTIVRDYPAKTTGWPFINDAYYPDGLELYLFDNKFQGIKGKELNKQIGELIKNGIPAALKTAGLMKGLEEGKVNIMATAYDPSAEKIKFIHIGKVLQSSGGKIKHTFDKNALFTFTSSGDSKKFNPFGATAYKDVSIDFYGVARRDGKIYKGKQMGFREKN